MHSHHFDDTQDGCLFEITDETFGLLRYRQIVAPREHVFDSVLLLCKTIEPKILAQAHLCRDFSVLREMVVEMLRL